MLPSVRPLVRQRTAAGLYGRCYGASGGEQASSSLGKTTECPMPELNNQSRSHTVLKQDSTLIAVLEMSQSAWLVAGLVPGIERHPLKKIEPDEAALLRLLRRWQEEATKAGHPITRITLAFEAGRDGFWLRGERGHCSMAKIPTLEEEDAKRPTREREGLVRERTRLVNRIKGA